MPHFITPQQKTGRLILCLGLMFVFASGIGCQNEQASETNRDEQGETKSNADDITGESPELSVASWKEVQQRIAQHRGKIVVVNIWLTTCETCLEEFPQFLALQKRYGKESLVCISLNGDYDGIKEKPPEYFREQTETFLAKQTLPGEHYLLNLPFIDFMDLVDLGSTPALFVYSQNGKLAKRFDNDNADTENEEFTSHDVTNLIDSLLTSEGH